MNILTDDRCAGKYSELCDEMLSEWEWLTNIPMATWQRLAEICGGEETASELRSECYVSALASSTFLHWRFLSKLQSYPWKLVEGDVSRNLDELLRHESPLAEWDDTTEHVYTLLRLDYDRDRVIEALMLLKQIPWSTAGVEQAHASAAIVSRLHPMAALDSVAQRSFCHTALPLVRDKRGEVLQRKIATLEERLERLRRKTGKGISGRQMFLEDIVAGASVVKDRQHASQELKVLSMRVHADLWRGLSPEDQALYDRRAAVHRESYKADVETKRSELRDAIRAKKAELLAPIDADKQLTLLSSNRLTEEDLQKLDEMIEQPQFKHQQLLAKRHDSLAAPRAPLEEQRKLLSDMKVKLERPDPQMKGWVKNLGYYRRAFRNCPLVFNLGTPQESSMLFLFGLQKPLAVGLTRLEKQDVVLPSPRSVRFGSFVANINYLDTIWPWKFSVPFNKPVWGHQINKEVTEVWVLRLMEFTGGAEVSSPCEPVPFLDFIRDFPAPRQPRAAGGEGAAGAGSSSSSTAGARILPVATGAASSSTGAASSSSGATGSGPVEAAYEELDDAELTSLRDWLHSKRSAMATERAMPQVHFEAACVGSAWAAKTRGVGADVSRAYGKNAAAKNAKEVLGNEMASFLSSCIRSQ